MSYAKKHAQSLEKYLNGFGIVKQGNSNDLVKRLPPDHSQYSLAYLDSYGGKDLYIEAISIATQLAKKYKYTDIVINVNATSIKRSRSKGNTDVFIVDALNSIDKKFWIISEPYDKHQWCFAIGTNWKPWAIWEREGFYSIDSPDGQEILTIINFTKNENPQVKSLIKRRKDKKLANATEYAQLSFI